jgi:hypothetical protein
MKRRGLGFLLVLTFLIGIAALVQDFRFHRQLSLQHDAANQTERTLGSAELALANLRTAEASYLATGQGPDFWMKRGTELSAQIEGLLTGLQSSTTSAEARPHYDAALSALGSLNGIDQKARDAVSHGERFLASDVVFMDAMEATRRLGAEMDAALDAERSASAGRMTRLQMLRLALNAATVAVLCGLIFLLVRRDESAAQPLSIAPIVEPLPVPEPVVMAPPAPPPAPEPRADPNLAEAADVCIDLARVLDGRDVPPLLERAAHVLDAKGLVLWVADDQGATLRPTLAHGYSDRVLQRLGALGVEADNVTSLAFRSMKTQVLSSAPHGTTSAIAVPLMTSAGCVGVLAAEVRDAAGEFNTVPVAKMFAAQLATIVAPMSSDGSQTAAQA